MRYYADDELPAQLQDSIKSAIANIPRFSSKSYTPVVLDIVVENLPPLYDGLFRVASDGKIYRKTDGGYVLAPQSFTGDKRNRAIVCGLLDGHSRHFYVHRLVAEAHIPNPCNLPEVNHIDGNPRNNIAENLEWVTGADNKRHAFASGLIPTVASSGVPCVACGELTIHKSRLCPACRTKQETKYRRLLAREKAANEAMHYLGTMDYDYISDRDLTILHMRASGATLEEVGNAVGLTRERVRQILDDIGWKLSAG